MLHLAGAACKKDEFNRQQTRDQPIELDGMVEGIILTLAMNSVTRLL